MANTDIELMSFNSKYYAHLQSVREDEEISQKFAEVFLKRCNVYLRYPTEVAQQRRRERK